MALDILEVFGTEYSGVAGIKATDDYGSVKTYIRPQGGISITTSGTIDVAQYSTVTVVGGTATTPATSISVTPTIEVGSGGLITATVSSSRSVTPIIVSGYISNGTAGNIAVSGTNTSQLSIQAAQTIIPSTVSQYVNSGVYLTGSQTIQGDVNLVPSNIASGVSIFGVVGTHEGGGGGSDVDRELVERTVSQYTNTTVNIVGIYAFAWAQNLQSVYLPNCSSVRMMAFCNCTSLKDVNLETCNTINDSAFLSCTALSYISLPSCLYI